MPAKIRHKQLTMLHLMEKIRRPDENRSDPLTEEELNASFTFENGEWIFTINALQNAIIEDEVLALTIKIPFKLKGKRWVQYKPMVFENGERDTEFEGDFQDAIMKLMGGGGGGNTGDITAGLTGGTGNKGFGSVDVRKGAVIRT